MMDYYMMKKKYEENGQEKNLLVDYKYDIVDLDSKERLIN